MSICFKSNCTCPCCSYPLLCHISSGRVYWRCQRCYEEMPDLVSLNQERFLGMTKELAPQSLLSEDNCLAIGVKGAK